MNNYNYKVVAVLKTDLSDAEKKFITELIAELMRKMGIVNVDKETFCKAQPIKDYDDFAPVGFFFVELENFKDYFSKLEYYNMWRGEVDIAV